MDSAPSGLKQRMAREAEKIKGERRRVAVMFADITGFSELSRRRDPEELKRLIGGAFGRLTEIVFTYEGFIDKIIGDSLMVLFGAPIARENDSERAVLCAFRLLETIRTYSAEQDADLNLSIGISRGLCYAGEYGRPGDYTVIGSDVNLAERLEKLAAPGTVYVSEGVYKVTCDRIDFKKIGRKGLKGVGEQIVYQAVAPASRERERIPFVGRKRELSELAAYLDEARAGKGLCAFITGERGIGKSRLYAKFAADSLGGQDVFFGQARGVSYLRNEFYHVLAQVLMSVIGAGEEFSADKRAQQLRAFLQNRDELKYAIPTVKYLLSLPADDKERSSVEAGNVSDNIKGIISSFLLRLSDEKPVVIGIEDAQYIDSSSLAFISDFSKRIGKSRIFIVMLCWEPVVGVWSQAQLVLPPLSHNDIVELVKLHFKGRPPSSKLIETVFKMTKGNPLFIEEILEILKQDDMLDIGKTVELAAEKIDIPDRIYNIVLARIDKLDQPAKELLKRASVIGFEFTDILLSKMGSGSSFADPMHTIQGKDFVRYVCDASYNGDKARVYMFKNEIIKDVAYELILKQERAELHRSLARALEQLHADNINPYIDTIAHHLLEASDERAAEYLLRSGKRKLDGYRLDEALADFNACLEIKQDAAVYYYMADAYYRKSEYGKAIDACGKAESAGPDDELKGRIASIKGKVFQLQGKHAEAEELYLRAGNLLVKTEHKIGNLNDLGSLYADQGAYDKATKVLNKALELCDESKSEHFKAINQTYNSLGRLYTMNGDFHQADRCYRKSLEIGRELYGETHPNVAVCYNNIAILNSRQGKYEESVEGFKKALDIKLAILDENNIDIAYAYNNLGAGYFYINDFGNALEYMKKALEIVSFLFGPQHPEVASYNNNISQIYSRMGEYGKTGKYLEKALWVWEKIPRPQPKKALCFGNAGEYYLLKGEYEKAEEYLKRSHEMYVSLLGKEHMETGQSYLRLVRFCYDRGDCPRALEYLTPVLGIYREKMGKDHPTYLWNEAFLVKIYAKTGELDKARAEIEEYYEAFEQRKDSHPGMAADLVPYFIETREFGKAKTILARVLSSQLSEKGNPRPLAETYILYSGFELARGEAQKAAKYALQALDAARKLGLVPLLIDSLTAAARASGDRKYVDEALTLSRKISDKYREKKLLESFR